MERLPSHDERANLLDALADLIEARGAATFVSAPLLEPPVEHFPDPWRADELGVERLARRLLTYVGLGELGVNVELFLGEATATKLDERGIESEWAHTGAAAWFAGIEAGICYFGAAIGKLDEPDHLAGVMAHEVAHAYRHHHGLVVEDRDVEERLTDLTTIYLGFGLLTTNASYRYRASGEMMGAYTRTSWSHGGVGYLSPQAMSFLLAAQVVARARESRRQIAGRLEPNQASYFSAACAALESGPLAERLGLPPSATWPAVVAPAPVPFDVSHDPPPVLARDAVEEKQRRERNAGVAVFRVEDRPAWRTATGAVVGAGLAIAAYSFVTLVGSLVVVAGAIAFGRRLDRRRIVDRCCESDCRAIIPKDATHCPGCGGTVGGRIAHRDERLAARERLTGEPEQDEDDDADDPVPSR